MEPASEKIALPFGLQCRGCRWHKKKRKEKKSNMDYQNIFNQDFYPTPVEVIDRMVGLSDISGKIILDPSCGSGNIINYCYERGAKRVLGCEINDKLRAISSSKCEMIGEDFLMVKPEQICHVDMIIQNPPFSNQQRHIEHAWSIAPGGCEIISLCNSAMFERRSYTKTVVQELIENYGSVEHIGSVFADSSERRTDVSCSIIHLYKPKSEDEEFADYFTDEEDAPELNASGIMPYNEVRECVNRYVAAVQKFDSVMEASREINGLVSGLAGDYFIKFGAYRSHGTNYKEITREYFKRELQKKAWRWIFEKFNMEKYVTSGVLEQLNKAIELQEKAPFTMRNIYRMLEMIVGTHGNRMQNVLCEAFDLICSFSADNSTAGEKWKTNSNYMINRKFIVPCITGYDSRFPSDVVSLTWSRSHESDVSDMIKALCYFTGTPYEVKDEEGHEISSLREFYSYHKCYYGEWYDWRFFRIKAFKKGTIHFEFKDEDVWYRFNQAVASTRGWNLPQKTKKRK